MSEVLSNPRFTGANQTRVRNGRRNISQLFSRAATAWKRSNTCIAGCNGSWCRGLQPWIGEIWGRVPVPLRHDVTAEVNRQ